jgi:hypothetical protein
MMDDRIQNFTKNIQCVGLIYFTVHKLLNKKKFKTFFNQYGKLILKPELQCYNKPQTVM